MNSFTFFISFFISSEAFFLRNSLNLWIVCPPSQHDQLHIYLVYSQIFFLVTRISWLLSVLFDTLWCPPHTILVIITIVCKEKNKSMWDELRYFTSDCRQISMRTDSMIGIGGTFSCSFTKNIITHFFRRDFDAHVGDWKSAFSPLAFLVLERKLVIF